MNKREKTHSYLFERVSKEDLDSMECLCRAAGVVLKPKYKGVNRGLLGFGEQYKAALQRAKIERLSK